MSLKYELFVIITKAIKPHGVPVDFKTLTTFSLHRCKFSLNFGVLLTFIVKLCLNYVFENFTLK